jgi:hypothetical protein
MAIGFVDGSNTSRLEKRRSQIIQRRRTRRRSITIFFILFFIVTFVGDDGRDNVTVAAEEIALGRNK